MNEKTNWPERFNNLWCLMVVCITLFGGGCLLHQRAIASSIYFAYAVIIAIALCWATRNSKRTDRWLGTLQFISACSMYPLLGIIDRTLSLPTVDAKLLSIDNWLWLGTNLPARIKPLESYWLSEIFSFCYLALYSITLIIVI